MRVVGFVGPSGTGKSYRALWIAKQKGLEYIIDDGLLIGHNKVLAGFSAKKELTKLAAVKRACFVDQNHVNDVKSALDQQKAQSVLILGTSDGMVDVIAKALELGEIEEYVRIEDVATKDEMDKALSTRKNEGKHVIPVPTFELKKTFSGYFMDAIKILRKKDNVHFTAEKTVVRPTYSYLGKYIISDNVIKQLATHAISQIHDVEKVASIDVENIDGSVSITVSLIMDYSSLDKTLFPKIQGVINEEVERLTCMNVAEVNIVLKSISVAKR